MQPIGFSLFFHNQTKKTKKKKDQKEKTEAGFDFIALHFAKERLRKILKKFYLGKK